MHRRPQRLVGTAACAALVAATAALTGPSSAAEDPASTLALRGADSVTTRSYDGWVYTDFGLRLIAAGDPVEVHAHRPSYRNPIEAEWVNPPDGAPRALPEGSMSSFAGLDDFVTIEIVRVADGTLVDSFSPTVCLNGYAQRIDPAAPARSPYPYSCPSNPYTVGSVMGIEGGYSVSLLSEWGSQLRLQPGRYDVTATIAEPYAELFGVTDLGRSTETRLVVRRASGWSARPSPERAASSIARPAAAEPAAEPGCSPTDPKPDLRSLPAWNIGLNGRGTVLRFAANVWNAGNSPLVVDGFRGEHDDRMDAYQYFFDRDGRQVCHQEVGTMRWHGANHRHWHFEDFAQYALVSARGRDAGTAVLSDKQSFCLANTDAVDYTVPGADWHPENTDLGTACGGRDALSVRQVLSAGSGDTYLQVRRGQAFRIGDLADGVYWIAVRANRDLNLVESDYTNNDSYRRVRIGTNRRGERFVRVPQVGIVDEGGGPGSGF